MFRGPLRVTLRRCDQSKGGPRSFDPAMMLKIQVLHKRRVPKPSIRSTWRSRCSVTRATSASTGSMGGSGHGMPARPMPLIALVCRSSLASKTPARAYGQIRLIDQRGTRRSSRRVCSRATSTSGACRVGRCPSKSPGRTQSAPPCAQRSAP